MDRGWRGRLLGSLTMIAGMAGAPLLHAQADRASTTGAPEGRAVSEVVVTAEKRTERLVEAPLSVSAVSGASLEQLHATSLQDWAGYVPGLNVVQNGAPGLATLAIDGIAPIGAASEVGLYVGDTPVGSSSSYEGSSAFSIDLMPYDLDRVEVLRGPQGTLYGASAMGGVIKYVLAAPDLDSVSGRIGGDVLGVQNGRGVGGGGRGEVNLPLVQDRLGLRASVYDENTPGYIDDATTGQKGDNAVRQAGGRIALLWKPTADLSVQLGSIYQFSHADNLSVVSLGVATGRPQAGALDNINTLPEPYTQELQLYDATIDWDLHWAHLTSITSYQTFTNDTTQDLSRYIGAYLNDFGAPAPGLSDFHEDYRLKKVTQEVRLASPEHQKFEWQLGAFYTHETGTNYEVFNAYDLTRTPLANLNPLEFVRLPSTYEEYAVFGDATYHFTDYFDLSAGVRYAHNDQTFTQYQGGALVDPATPTQPGVTVPGRSNEGVATFSVAPRLHLNKDTIAYLRIASGYQPGGPNVVLPGVTGLPATFTSSRLLDYQVGIKSTLLDGRASVDVSAFHIDWSRIQVGVLIGNESAIENAGAATSEGFDLAGTISPLAGLTLGASANYTDAVLTAAVPSIGAAVGARLPYVPMWQGSLSVQYERAIGGPWRGFVGGGYRYTGSRYSSVQGATANGQPQGLEARAYGVADMHLGARTADLTLSLFARNLGDDRAYLAPVSDFFDALGMPIEAKAPVLQPRTIGFSIDKSF